MSKVRKILETTEVGGERLFWKIDCTDPMLRQGSENPGNETATHRVLTIMLASEY